MITAIILAAGMSKRMGTNKLLLPFKGKTVIETVIDVLKESAVDDIILVTGNEEDRLKEALKGYKLSFTHNKNYKNGLSTSVKAGLQSISKETHGILFIPGDQPMITAEDIDKIIKTLSKESTIVVPRNDLRKGSPAAFYKTWFEELKTIVGDQGGRVLIKKYPDKVTYVHIDTPYFFEDVDTKESYEKLMNLK